MVSAGLICQLPNKLDEKMSGRSGIETRVPLTRGRLVDSDRGNKLPVVWPAVKEYKEMRTPPCTLERPRQSRE